MLSPLPRRLRVLDGPLRGAVLPIGDRFVIGRSSLADLQLIDPGVSREHAEIVAAPDGCHWLVDRGSHNGTFAAGERVQRLRLKLDSVFEIEGSSFVLDPAFPTTDPDHSTLVVAPAVPTSRFGPRGLASRLRAGPSESAESSGRRTMHQVTARDDSGVAYEGNLVEDIAEHRALSLGLARCELRSTGALARYEALSRRLQLPERLDDESSAPRQLYARFSTSFPVGLRRSHGQALVGVMVDLGVDGAQVLAYDHELRTDELLWLVVELVCGRRRRSLVLKGQVTWTSTNHLGLHFFGPHQQRGPDLVADDDAQTMPREITVPRVRSVNRSHRSVYS